VSWRRLRLRGIGLVAAAFVVAAAGCGDDDDDAGAHADGGGGARDAGRGDAGARDAGARDAGRDAGAAWEPPELALPDPEAAGEYWLSETGLYIDIADKQLAPDLLAFEPAYALWSDGADKQRWLRLPDGTQIDSSDMDHWQFPIGTVLFKEFAHAGKRLETRMIVRTGPEPEDYWMGAFAWLDDESDALFVPDGRADVRGTQHDVPKVRNCFTCHNGDRGRVLGFSAVQQPEVDAALLTDPPATPFATPGDAVTAAALGYLHANCGHCHNPGGTARPDTDMNLRLAVSNLQPEDTATYQSTIGVALQYFDSEPFTDRVVAGDPDASGLLFRMTQRGPRTQMPPLATEQVDNAGVEHVRAWIESLP
jgi:hypothetical protein